MIVTVGEGDRQRRQTVSTHPDTDHRLGERSCLCHSPPPTTATSSRTQEDVFSFAVHCVWKQFKYAQFPSRCYYGRLVLAIVDV